MGFWHTGYMEFHEPTGTDWTFVPTPIRFSCQHCKKSFDSMDALRRHRFENHRFSRPLMFVRGIELGVTPLQVTRPLAQEDVQTDRVTAATVNGDVISLSELPLILSNKLNDRVTVVLSNEGANATFELLVRIAKEEHLAGVEAAFLKMAKSRLLTIRSVEGFIAECKGFETASLYCDGLCHYLYGVLAKERAPDSGLNFDEYPTRFTRAADELQGYDRSLAQIVQALVAFNFNHFEDSHNLAPPGRLRHAAVLFSGLLEGFPWQHEFEHRDTEMNGLVDLLTDHETLRILRWTELGAAELVKSIDDLQGQLKRDIPGYDKFKIQMLLAEALAFKGDSVGARRVAREFMSNQRTQAWAEALVARLSQTEN
jgi:hypothetical protein